MLLEWLPAESGRLWVWVVGTLFLTVCFHFIFNFLNKVYKGFKLRKQLEDFKGPPMHWLWGTSEQCNDVETEIETRLGWQRRFGPVIKVMYGPLSPAIDLSDPESIRIVLSTLEPKSPFVAEVFKSYVGPGVLFAEGHAWLRSRRLLTPSFHFDVLRRYVLIFNECAHTLITKWRNTIQETPRQEMFDHISLMTFDSLVRCTFGYQGDDNIQGLGTVIQYVERGGVWVKAKVFTARVRIRQPSGSEWVLVTGGREDRDPYPDWSRELVELAYKRFCNPTLENGFFYKYFTADGRRFHELADRVHQKSEQVIAERRRMKATTGAGTERRLNFVDILLDARDEEGKGLTDTEIRHEADTFMFAGHDTTASTLCWFLYNMASHPEIQERCYEEVISVTGANQDIAWNDLSKLTYTTMCIKETLRLHTTVPYVGRETTRETTLPCGRVIPKGTLVDIALYMLHHNPEVWTDPFKFNPERFSIDNVAKQHPYAFIPFSAGSRNCIGQNFAMNELKTVTSLLLKNFRFSYKENKPPVALPAFVLRAKDGLWLNIEER